MEPTGLCPWTSTALVVGAMEEKEYRQRQEHVASGGASAPEPPRATRSQSDPYNFLYFPQFLFFQCVRHLRFSKKVEFHRELRKREWVTGFRKHASRALSNRLFWSVVQLANIFLIAKSLPCL